MSTISCVITSFNNGPYLRQAVESVLDQTRRPDEIIIADDGSTDGSRDLVRELANQHDCIRPVLREQNLGVAANRDLAIRTVGTVFFTTLDGDDFCYPEKIARELELLRGRLDAVSCSDFTTVDEAGKVTGQRGCRPFAALENRADRLRYMLYRQGPLPRDMTYSRQLYEEVNGFRHELRMYEDWDLKMRVANRADRWEHTGATGIAHRLHDQGLSAANRLTHLAWQLRVITENRQWLGEALDEQEVYNALLKRVVHAMGYRGAKLVP